MDFSKINIIKNPKEGAFTQDALFLSMFIILEGNERIIELGTGTGIISIAIAENYKNVKLTAIEILKEMYETAKINIEENKLNKRIELINNDFRKTEYNADIIIMNPPFVKKGTGRKYNSIIRKSSRSEEFCCMEDIFKYCSKNLKLKGKLYLIYPIERLTELLNLSVKYSIIGKRIRFIYLNSLKNATRFMFEGIYKVNNSLKIEQPLYIYNKNNEYSNELKKSFFGEIY